MSPRYSALGNAIREARLRRKLTQDQLAERVGARGGRWTVIKWEQGLHKPTEYAAGLIRELGLDEELFADDDEEEDAADMALARDLLSLLRRVAEERVA